MRTITILAMSVAALPCVPAMAQVSASGPTRLRVETTDGQARAGFNESDTLLNLRTALAAQYEEGPVKVVGELWDILPASVFECPLLSESANALPYGCEDPHSDTQACFCQPQLPPLVHAALRI